MALGLLDRCCSAKTIMKCPAIYELSQNRTDFNDKVNEYFLDVHIQHDCLCYLFVDLDILVMDIECCVSFDYSIFHVVHDASTW
jgi:hypothetical protein